MLIDKSEYPDHGDLVLGPNDHIEVDGHTIGARQLRTLLRSLENELIEEEVSVYRKVDGKYVLDRTEVRHVSAPFFGVYDSEDIPPLEDRGYEPQSFKDDWDIDRGEVYDLVHSPQVSAWIEYIAQSQAPFQNSVRSDRWPFDQPPAMPYGLNQAEQVLFLVYLVGRLAAQVPAWAWTDDKARWSQWGHCASSSRNLDLLLAIFGLEEVAEEWGDEIIGPGSLDMRDEPDDDEIRDMIADLESKPQPVALLRKSRSSSISPQIKKRVAARTTWEEIHLGGKLPKWAEAAPDLFKNLFAEFGHPEPGDDWIAFYLRDPGDWRTIQLLYDMAGPRMPLGYQPKAAHYHTPLYEEAYLSAIAGGATPHQAGDIAWKTYKGRSGNKQTRAIKKALVTRPEPRAIARKSEDSAMVTQRPKKDKHALRIYTDSGHNPNLGPGAANFKPHVRIYTDGGCSPNPGPGAWAAVLTYWGGDKAISGATSSTTNNRMELTAAIEALRALKRPCVVTLYTDSRYLQQGITEWMPRWIKNAWLTNRKPIKNQDLWEALAAETTRHEITWEWVKGHAGDKYNELVDRLVANERSKIS